MRRAIHIMTLGSAILSLVLVGCDNGGNNNSDGGDTCLTVACDYYHQCDSDEDCIDGCCKRSTRCTQDATCQPGGLCLTDDGAEDGRCVHLCINDTDCPEGDMCYHGMCEPFPADVLAAFQADPPDMDGTTQTALQVGIGDVPLDFPVGVSMAGYGARIGPRTPYRNTLGGSERVWDKPRVKAYVFDNGLKRFALVRLATSWSTDYLVSDMAYRLYQATGENWINRIVISGNHTHSYPGRFSFWIPDRSMGVLGHGDFSPEMFHRHAKSGADAILAAIDDLQPSKMAYTYLEPMDPEHNVHSYRRGEFEAEMLDNLVTIRIDDMDGNPRAVLFNFALHGTHSMDTAVTGDSPGAVEIVAQQRLQELTGLPVKATFFSGASGDVSPRGDGQGMDDWRVIQQVGFEAWPIIKGQFEAMEGQTESDVAIDIASIRLPVNREALGYGPGEFIDNEGNEYTFGAFQCAGQGDSDPSTVYEDGDLGCIFSAEMLSGGVPVSPFCKARMSALRLGDLGLTTIPGEPLSNLSRDAIQGMLDAGFAHANVLGYSQDHHLYIMKSDNWMQGGYEPSMDIWGWGEGDYYLAKNIEMSTRFGAEGGFEEDNGMMPGWYRWEDDTVAPTATSQVGAIVQDAPASVERPTMISILWTGGHPGVDLPRMTLEHNDGSGWAPVLNGAGVPYSCDGFSTMLWYRGDYDLDHTWQLDWEERIDFPAGTYRIAIAGHYFDGSGTQEYTTASGEFELVPSTRLIIAGLTLSGDQISGAVLYPSGPTNDDGQTAFTTLKPLGYLHHGFRGPPEMPQPTPQDGTLSVDITIQPPTGDPVEVSAVSVDGEGEADYTFVNGRDDQGVETFETRSLPASTFNATHGAGSAAGTYDVTVTVTDALGNTGQSTVQLVVD